MYIVLSGEVHSTGDTVEEAISNMELEYGGFDPNEDSIYEAKEIKVQRKFEVIKED